MIESTQSIAFATVCRDESACIIKTLEAVALHAAHYVICDTGSKDDTIALCEDFFRRTGKSGQIYRDQWIGFDHNKTLMMQRARATGAAYTLHLDADDWLIGTPEFAPGLDYYAAQLRRGDARWNATVLYSNARTWEFIGVAHTIIKCEIAQPTLGKLLGCHVDAEERGHRALDPQKYLRDAEKLAAQFEHTSYADPHGIHARSAFYCGQSYMDQRMYPQALRWYRTYLALSDWKWSEETFEAELRVARCMMTLRQDLSEVRVQVERAVALQPDRAEPHYWLGTYAQQLGDSELAASCFARAASMDLDGVLAKYELFVNSSCYSRPAPVSTHVRGRSPKFLVVDDFLPDPDAVRAHALTQTYVADERYHKGRRTQSPQASETLRREFERLLGVRVTKWDYPTNGVFQYCVAADPVVYHRDEQRWAGVIHLTPNSPPECGTSFFRARSQVEFDGGFYDRTKFELIDAVGCVYNRLVLWDARQIHAASGYFGQKPDDARLFQVFFFDAEAA